MVDQNSVGRKCRLKIVEHRTYVRIIAKAEHDKFSARDAFRRAVHHAASIIAKPGLPFSRFLRRPVPHCHPMAPGGQMTCHGRAHDTQPEKGTPGGHVTVSIVVYLPRK